MLVSVPVFAGPSTIGGTVKNEWGDSMIGAYVWLKGTEYFAAASPNGGGYEIKRVPPGMYDILYSNTYYDSLLVCNVPVDHDTTLILHVVLTLATGDGMKLDTFWYSNPPAPEIQVDSVKTDSSLVEEP
jgi:hypothetical protein